MLRAALQPPDQPTTDDEQNRNQLRSRHQAAEDFAASGIVAQELDEVTFDSIQNHESTPHLSIKFLTLEEPGEEQEIAELGRGLDQLRRFNPDAEWSSTDRIRQRIIEDHTPEVARRFAVTATGRETAEAAEYVSKGKPGSEGIGCSQRRHVVTPHVPGRHQERANQSAGEHASCLHGVDAENLAPVFRVVAPVVDDVKNFRPDNSSKNNENSKIPCIVAVDALLLRIAHTDPEPDQYARGDQHTIGGQVETTNMKKSGEHVSLDAPIAS